MKHGSFKGRVFAVLCAFGILLAAASCDLLMPKGEVYISADGTFGDYGHICRLFSVYCVDKGAAMNSGENIISQSTGTRDYGGRTWKIYQVPRYEWDIVFGYFINDDDSYGRETINLDLNDWAAIWVNGDNAFATDCYQSSGTFEVPNL